MAVNISLLILFATSALIHARIEMEFTKWPESVTAPVGDTVTFECAVTVPGEGLKWRWKPDSEDASWMEVEKPYDSDSISTRLAVEVKEDSKPAFYQCVVSYGGVVLTSVPARLTISKIDLSRNVPEKRVITVPVQNTVALHCREPLSEPPAVLTWWKEHKGKKTQIDTPHGVLVIPNATTDDSGSYFCSATNELSGQVVELPERIYLKVQHEPHGNVRFLESEEYVGTLDKEGVLTAPVRPGGTLRLWCGAVGTPPPSAVWVRQGRPMPARAKYDGAQLSIANVRPEDEGIYSCVAGSVRRSWKVVALQPAQWQGSVSSVNGTEGGGARVSCGVATGQPPPKVYWMLNGKTVDNDPLIQTTESELSISVVQKRHASIVQCFACNMLGCAYDAAFLAVVPVQITDREYSVESGKSPHSPSQSPKRHNRKNARKHTNKAVLVPPSRPNVTRMSDESVMVSWSNGTDGLPILFFKVQYKEAMNSSNAQWNTCNMDIPPHVHSYQINGLTPDRYYKFRISAVYSNQDNKQGRSSGRFYLQQGGFRSPKAPVLINATAQSPTSILLNWTWSSGGGVQAEGFYVYCRAISSAGEYVKVTAPGGAAARSIVLSHLLPDTRYEVKVQAYTAQAPSEFTVIQTAKTLPSLAPVESSSRGPEGAGGAEGAAGAEGGGRWGALLPAGGGAALVAGGAALALLCRRRHAKEKVAVPEGGGSNGYIPAKVPITITANPMHAEGGESGVEMSYMHNNNTGSEDSTLPISRKNGPTRQYV